MFGHVVGSIAWTSWDIRDRGDRNMGLICTVHVVLAIKLLGFTAVVLQDVLKSPTFLCILRISKSVAVVDNPQTVITLL